MTGPQLPPDPPPGFRGGMYWRGKWRRTPLRYRIFSRWQLRRILRREGK